MPKLRNLRRRLALYLSAFRQAVFKAELPDLTARERTLLGQFAESDNWKAFVKYLETERRDARDNGLIHAKDLVDFAHIQGDINRCNKIEADMHLYMAEMQEARKKKELATEEPEEQDDEE